MEDDVGARQQLLQVLLAHGKVVVVEVSGDGADLLVHIGTHFFDFLKQLERKWRSCYQRHGALTCAGSLDQFGHVSRVVGFCAVSPLVSTAFVKGSF